MMQHPLLRASWVAGAAMLAACASSAPAKSPVKNEGDLAKANKLAFCMAAADRLMLVTERSSDAYAQLRNDIVHWNAELEPLAVDSYGRRQLLSAGAFGVIDVLGATPDKSDAVKAQEILSSCPRPSNVVGQN